MKKARKFFALFLCFVLFCSAFGLTSYEAKDDDDEDYAVFDVGFDVSDDSIYIYWETGSSKCSYKVELYKSSNMTTKNRVGDVMTVSYSAAKVDVTQRIINKGSGTYYARVTCKKKAKGEEDYEYAIGSETISSEEPRKKSSRMRRMPMSATVSFPTYQTASPRNSPAFR